MGHKARGYKVFGLCDLAGAGVLEAWTLGPMNQSEPATAPELLERVEAPSMPATRKGKGWLLADCLYDTNELYEQAHARGWQLLARRRSPGAGLGHRDHSPHRLAAIATLECPLGEALYARRGGVERFLGQMSSFGGGLQPLPSWVRRPHRVALWIQAKVIINLVRLTRKPTSAA